MNSPSPHPTLLQSLGGTLLSGLAFFFAIDLSGSYGWLLWIAPLPILLIAFRSSGRQAFLWAFIACLLGRLNWVPFLFRVLPPPLVVVFTVLIPLFYALVIVGTRKVVLARTSFISVFAYPVLLTASEYILLSLSYDGTAGSLAYTQSNYLSIIQIASVTGIWGILFITALIPSTLAVAWHLKSNSRQMQFALMTGSLCICAVMAFGWIRLNREPEHTSFIAGLTAVPEKMQRYPETPVFADEEKKTQALIQQFLALADQGADVVLFPEKSINATEQQKDSILSLLRKATLDSKVAIVGGITVFKPGAKQNLVEYISDDGTIQEYKKVFHVKGFEDDFERGSAVGFLQATEPVSGMAICKDMDYPAWLRKYQKVDVMFVPAWDFVVDGWLHCRMAVMRGVENGFTIVRSARQGRLTVSDYRGQVLSEASCQDGNEASLLAEVPVYSISTIYSSWGDWFGILSSVLALVWIVLPRPRSL